APRGMTVWIVLSENPYVAVTDQKGGFKIENVPPGTYSLEIWHETLGPTKQQVTVKARETVPVALELKKWHPGLRPGPPSPRGGRPESADPLDPRPCCHRVGGGHGISPDGPCPRLPRHAPRSGRDPDRVRRGLTLPVRGGAGDGAFASARRMWLVAP